MYLHIINRLRKNSEYESNLYKSTSAYISTDIHFQVLTHFVCLQFVALQSIRRSCSNHECILHVSLVCALLRFMLPRLLSTYPLKA